MGSKVDLSEVGRPFEFDVFISYAHDDDNTLVDENIGWVTQFRSNFEKLLNEQLGRHPKIWHDSDINPNEDFEKKIFNRLVKSAVFLPIVSKIYIKRRYCLRELREFAANVERVFGTGVDPDNEKKRIFIVEKLRVDRQLLPQELQGLGGTFGFYDRDNDLALRPMLRDLDRGRYLEVLNRLSKTIADLLDLLDKAQRVDTVDRLAVYVAETSSDIEDQRNAVCDDLADRGFLVLPDRELPRHVNKYKDTVRSCLERSVLSVHLIGQFYGSVPEGEQELSNVQLQHGLALERSEQDSRFSQVVWLAFPDEAPVEPRQRDFLAYLRNDEKANSHADLLESDIESLKTELHGKLDKLRQPREASGAPRAPGKTNSDAAGTGSSREYPPLVYIICEMADREAAHVETLRNFLFDRGFEATLPMEQSGADQALADHLRKLAECDAFLIYHGTGSEEWLETKVAEFRKYLRNREKPVITKAIYLAPPNTPQKQRYRTLEAMVLRSADDFDSATVEPFLADLHHITN